MFEELFNRRHDRPGDVFMDLLEKEKLIVAPGVYIARGAQTAKEIYFESKEKNIPCTFNAVYLGGWSISTMLLGRPDMGFIPLSVMEFVGRYVISKAHPLPVIMDAETGFSIGNLPMIDTVETYHKLGVALAHLEDQDGSKTRRCGNLVGKQCIEPEAMVEKILAWLMYSKEINTSMRLMARTDALTAFGGGIENAIERGKRYMDTDYQGWRPAVLWADAMIDPVHIERWVTELHKHDPKMVLGINYSPNKDWSGDYPKKFKQPPPTYQDLYRNGEGFRVIWHTILQARADAEATRNTFQDMAENGAQALHKLHERQRHHPVGDTQGMSNAPIWQALEKYLGGEEAVKRYEQSEGYGTEKKK